MKKNTNSKTTIFNSTNIFQFILGANIGLLLLFLTSLLVELNTSRYVLHSTFNWILTIVNFIDFLALCGFFIFGLWHIKQKIIRNQAMKRSLFSLVLFLSTLLFSGFLILTNHIGKPVIYIYPEHPQIVDVELDFAGELTVTYPKYANGWRVLAHPDGKIVNLADNKEYSYLFWEGKDKGVNYDLTSGFVVKGAETADFLQKKLSALGLTPKEYNEFIVYWLPLMQDNKYNLIHFATKEEYDDRAILNITPKPDSVLRVFMTFKALNHKVEVAPQEIKPFERKGFAVIEWGGTEIK